MANTVGCPPKSISLFYNYKGHSSMVLLGIWNANYTFAAVDVGASDSQSGGDILNDSAFGRRLFSNKWNIPQASVIANPNVMFPYLFVGGAGFSLHDNILRAYRGRLLSEK
ncbi:uncharacterized protein ACN427_004977 [Glossina fuscipes fuscipes]